MQNTRLLTQKLLLTAAYVLAGKAGLALASVNASATPVWLPTGIAIAAMLAFGSRAWPYVFAAALIVNQTTTGSWSSSIFIAAGNTGEALVARLCVVRLANGRDAFRRVRDVLLFVLLAGLLSPMVSATVGVTTLSLHGAASWGNYATIWLTWWLGNATGAIIGAPLLLLWIWSGRPTWSGVQIGELALLTAATAVIGWIIFVEVNRPLTFLCIPLCIWAGFRFGPREAAAVSALLSSMALWATVHGLGPFAFQSSNAALLSVQAFTAVTMLVGLIVGAAVTERSRTEEHVRALNDDLERRVRVRTRELERTLDDLRMIESRLAEAQEVAHVGSWEWQVPEDRGWWSDELYRIYGCDRQSCQPTRETFLRVVHPEDRQRVTELAQQALADGEPFDYEHRIVRPDGEVRTLRGTARVDRDEQGRAVRLLGTAQDITEHRGFEAQLLQAQKRETLGQLVSGVAHDFNNLLTVITGHTDLVLDQVDDTDPNRESLIEVRNAARRAAALTRQLLIFGQRQALEPDIINLNAVIEAMDPMLRRVLGEQIVVTAALAADLAGIKADVSHIEQILMNLAVNARDAMPGGGQLTLETKNIVLDAEYGSAKPAAQPAGRYVRLAVTDTGCGMDDRVKTQIFRPFFTTKQPGQGTGLGLATAYNIVKRSNGYIWVYSELGRGTTFKLYFPAEGAPGPVAAPSSEGVGRELPPGVETVLLVEDDESVRAVARSALLTQGYRVLEARSGDEAGRLVAEEARRIDLVVTDVVMPGMDGPQLVSQLRVIRPALKALFISGYAERAVVQHGLVPTGSPFLEKPFTPEQLLREIRTLLDAQKAMPDSHRP